MKAQNYTDKRVIKVEKEIKTSVDGTHNSYVTKYLKKRKFSVVIRYFVPYKKLKKILESKKNIILSIHSKFYDHDVSVVSVNSKGIWITNSPKFSNYHKENIPLNLFKSKVFFTFEQLKWFCTNSRYSDIDVTYFYRNNNA